jgi:hypothetical protein
VTAMGGVAPAADQVARGVARGPRQPEVATAADQVGPGQPGGCGTRPRDAVSPAAVS